ncbi:MAG TPA: VWA domain-containing protein [Terracidiphilus sp.]|nr:VWA domain-containing protein [Terracidiphilus sp.]
MRRFLILGNLLTGILIAAVPPLAQAKQMTVAQLEQMLNANVRAHKSDVELAKHIADVEMKERISPAELARLNVSLRADPQAMSALRILADRSQFRDSPASERIGTGPPDSSEQVRLLGAAHAFASKTLPGLPNFLATRTINLYDDTPHALKKGNWPTRNGLHLVGTSQAEITVRRERENQPPTQGSAVFESKVGLVSGGEFGTTLGMILTDVAEGKVSWSHWEKSQAGLAGVFNYSVPAGASHFELISSFKREASVEGFSASNGGRVAGIGVRQNVSSNNVAVEKTRAGYHGSIWIDSGSGVIERVTLEADTGSGMPFRNAAILVDYGWVEIAGNRYICPVRSLAYTEALATTEMYTSGVPTEWMNETLFTNYHRFGSSARIVEEAVNRSALDAGATGDGDTEASATEQSNARPTAQPQIAGSTAPAAQDLPVEIASTAESVQPTAEPFEVKERATPAPETATAHGSSDAKDKTEPSSPPPEVAVPAGDTQNGFTLHVSVNSLLVPAVVVDKSGKSIGGLRKEDFEVMEDRKHLAVTGLTVVRSTASEAPVTEVPARSGNASTNDVLRSRRRFVVLLFDDRHMTVDDLPRVQQAVRALLAQPLGESEYVDVLSFMGVSSGITQERAALEAAVMKMTVHPLFRHAKEDCPDVDYYAADKIIRQHDPMAFQIAVGKAKACMAVVGDPSAPSANIYAAISNPTDMFQRAAMAAAARALAEGEEDTRESLLAVENVVRAMAKLPGQRVLILVSPGFLTMTPSAMAEKSEVMELAAKHEVVVNTMDARGLYTGSVGASEGGATSTLALMTGAQVSDRLGSMQANEDALAEIADGTGGKFFHNSNDLKSGLKTLSAAPENLYLLEVSLNGVKANGAYHALRVKVNRPGAEVTARKGFVAPKEK